MPTAYVARLIVVAPEAGARHTAVAAWLNANLSLTPVVPADLGPGLSPTGAAPATYRWCNVQLVAADAKAVLGRLCALAGVPPPTPAQWDDATPAQRRAWWGGVRADVWAGFGVWCQLAANDGQWDDPAGTLQLRGLRPVA